jgi:hypothetical protein
MDLKSLQSAYDCEWEMVYEIELEKEFSQMEIVGFEIVNSVTESRLH